MPVYIQDLKRYISLSHLEKYALLMINSGQKSRVTMKTRDHLRNLKLIDRSDKITTLGIISLKQTMKRDSKDGN
jgi:hypothetical protein